MLKKLVKLVRKNFPSSLSHRLLASTVCMHSKHSIRETKVFTEMFLPSQAGREYIVVRIPWTLKSIPDKLEEAYHNSMSFLIEITFDKIKKFIIDLESAVDYARHGYDSPDWDSAFLIRDIQFKLKRMSWEFENFGYGEKDPELARQMIKAHDMLDACLELDEIGDESEKSQQAGRQGFVYIANHFKGWWT